ncbi:MAG: preprotein translocase subunit YajC [Gammaproteobacteria bacterium]|nr:preprotein translocase subunit YajC [Gammaproteobacteria bacterium]|tara:strand:+ start:71 stop:445 length:375 start_codon:yes stop_codon:yes gene_type:complete
MKMKNLSILMTLLLVSACVPPNDGSGGGGEASFLPFLMLLTFFIFIYFVTIRPQQKRQKEHQTLVESLEKGDEVMTSSGLVGRVESVKDRYVSIKLNENVSINMQKEFISSKLPKGTINSIESQ